MIKTSVFGGNSYPMGMGQSSDITNPLASIYSAEKAPYILLGIDESDIPTTSFGVLDATKLNPLKVVSKPENGQASENTWPFDKAYEPDLNRVENQFLAWYEIAYSFFKKEKGAKIHADPEQIFFKALPHGINSQTQGIAPLLALTKIIEFLEDYQPSGRMSFAISSLFLNTIERLKGIEEVIHQFSSGKVNAPEGLSQVSDLALLEKDTDFIRNRLELFVRTILEEIMVSGKPEVDPIKLQMLIAGDVIKYFAAYQGESWHKLSSGAKASQSILNDSIVVFVESLKEKFNESLHSFDKQIKAYGEDVNGPNYHIKSKMCYNLLSYPWMSDLKEFSRCIGMEMPSLFQHSGAHMPVFSQKLLKTHVSKRRCLHRDFLRKEHVIQLLSGSKKPWPENSKGPIFESIKNKDPLFKEEPLEPIDLVVNENDPCYLAEAWRTNLNLYCESDETKGCNRKEVKWCRPINKIKWLKN